MDLHDAERVAQQALPLFGIDAQATTAFIKYRENHVFRATAPGASYAVRLHRPGYRDDDEVATELGYLRALRAAGVPVPDVVPTVEGALVAHVSAGGHDRLVSVQRWLDDAAAFGSVEEVLGGTHTPDPEEFIRIGALLGALHAAEGTLALPTEFRRGAWDAAGLAGDHPLWGDPRALPTLNGDERDAVGRAVRALHARLLTLPRTPDVYGVVHADATPENIMVTPAGFVLIDFDDFGTGWYAFDLATAVFHHALHPRYAEYEQAVLAGYASVRPLAGLDAATWDALLLARGLTYLGWAAERPGDPASDFVAASVAPWVAAACAAYADGEALPWHRPTGSPFDGSSTTATPASRPAKDSA
ncbi:phosphotransferase enzyme family protein [Microbacterium lacticum]